MKQLGMLLTLAVVGAIGSAQVPPQPPTPAPVLPILPLDLSKAVVHEFSPYCAAWMIPVKDFSDILNKPPSTDTIVGILILGSNLSIIYFKLERGIAYLTLRLPFAGNAVWATAETRWIAFAKEQEGKIWFTLTPPTPVPGVLKLKIKIDFGHKPGCEWYGSLEIEW